MSTYSEKLRHPKWQKKRLEILQRDEFKCKCCNSEDKNLQVHHLKYDYCEPWLYENRHLITLCEDCHKKEEELKIWGNSGIDYLISLGFLRTDIEKIVNFISRKTDPMNDIDTHNYFKKLKETITNG